MSAMLEGYAGFADGTLALWEEALATDRLAPQRAERESAVRTSIKAFRGFARVWATGRPRAWLCAGKYEWRGGRTRAAARAWEQSLRWSMRLRMPYEEALTHYEIARRTTAGAERAAHGAIAVTLFERLGAQHDLACARAVVSA